MLGDEPGHAFEKAATCAPGPPSFVTRGEVEDARQRVAIERAEAKLGVRSIVRAKMILLVSEIDPEHEDAAVEIGEAFCRTIEEPARSSKQRHRLGFNPDLRRSVPRAWAEW
jgi:hypothetical protein